MQSSCLGVSAAGCPMSCQTFVPPQCATAPAMRTTVWFWNVNVCGNSGGPCCRPSWRHTRTNRWHGPQKEIAVQPLRAPFLDLECPTDATDLMNLLYPNIWTNLPNLWTGTPPNEAGGWHFTDSFDRGGKVFVPKIWAGNPPGPPKKESESKRLWIRLIEFNSRDSILPVWISAFFSPAYADLA